MDVRQRTRNSLAILTFVIIWMGMLSQAFIRPPERRSAPDAGGTGAAQPVPTLLPEAMVNFKVTVPANTPTGEGIYLFILDEVTGLALNPQRTLMRASDPTHYMISIPIPIGSLVRYRYGRQSTVPADEVTGEGKALAYRLFRVDGPSLVQDTVARWMDTPFAGNTGSIRGTISDAASGQPIPNLIVSCGGMMTKSAANGSYAITGLPAGAHTLVAISQDGSYRSFQQGALVAQDSVTPASFVMTKAKLVSIVFTVSAPIDTPAEATLRIAGNLNSLGYTFGGPTLNGEMEITRMPKLVALGSRRYALALQLPAGTDLRYKYSLGDSLWNAERNASGNLYVRQLIVPEASRVVEEQISSWSDGSKDPLGFEYRPAAGAKAEAMSIQFYSHGWTQPIPLWNSPGNRQTYILYGPLKLVGQGFKYRFCAQGKCSMK